MEQSLESPARARRPDLARWFNAPYRDSGHYSTTGSSVKFSLTSLEGTVDYDGVVQGDSLQLNSLSDSAT